MRESERVERVRESDRECEIVILAKINSECVRWNVFCEKLFLVKNGGMSECRWRYLTFEYH